MSELASGSRVLLGCEATTVDEVLRLLADKSVPLGVSSDADALYEALKAREAQGTTGMMGGFAIPHAKCEAVAAPAIVVAKFREGITWNSMDGVPITCAISLLTPAAEASATHLMLLSRVAVMLMEEELRTKVLASEDPEEIAGLINAALDANAS